MKRILSFFHQKLFAINDSPHKIALGFGLGFFSGILPGTGPLAAIFLAFLFRANRASALAGAILTNTWISFVILTISLQVGAFLTKTDWQAVSAQAQALLKDFHWKEIFSASLGPVIKPLLVGYVVVGLFLGIVAYVVTLVGILIYRRKRKGAGPKSASA